MQLPLLPYTPDLTKKYLEKFLHFVEKREPYSLLGMYDGGQDYIFTLLKTTEVLSLVNHKVYLVDAHNKKEVTQILATLKQVDLSEHKVSVIFFLQPTKLLSREVESKLFALRNAYPWTFSYHFLGYPNAYYLASGTQRSIYLKNWEPKKLLDAQNSVQLLEMYIEAYKLGLSSKSKKQIVKLAGGNPGLIKGLAMMCAENNSCSIDYTHPQIHHRIFWIMRTIPLPILAELLEKGVSGLSKQSKTFLTKFDYLNQNQEFFAPWILDWAHNAPEIQELLLEYTLAPRLKRIYLLFKDNPGKIITREQIALILWGKDRFKKYSDWAIDRAIADLRKSLKGFKTVKTLKKQGFIMLG